MTDRYALTVDIDVPDAGWMIVAVQRMPRDWPVDDPERLVAALTDHVGRFSSWSCFVAGRQRRSRLHLTTSLLHDAEIGDWIHDLPAIPPSARGPAPRQSAADAPRFRRLSTVVLVPDREPVIAAIRHAPDWPVMDSLRLDAFAAANPRWSYLIGGEQMSRRYRAGSDLMHGPTVDRW